MTVQGRDKNAFSLALSCGRQRDLMRLPILLAAACLLATLAPVATAHGITPTPPESFQVLLQDRTDDCGPETVSGTGVASPQDCHGADALVGLALQEKWDGTQDQLVFRFYLDVGKAGPFTDTLTLGTPAGAKTLSIKSSDDKSFTNGGGFDSVGAVQAVAGEKSRFTVDATVSRATLGVSVGDALTGYHVESKSGSAAGDEMPGGCHNTVGDCTAGATDEYVYGGGAGKYTVRGPSYYADLSGPTGPQAATAGKDLDTPIMLNLKNDFHRLAQTFTLSVEGADGVTAGFHAGGNGMGAEYKAPLDVALDGGAATVLHLNLHGDRAGASGTLTITATSDAGGRTQIQVPYTVQDAGTPAPTGDDTGATSGPASTSKGSPAPAAPLAGLLMLGLALRRRA
jgi:hypothetical protein